jgi:hypothetical protein
MADSGFATMVTMEQLRQILTNTPPVREGVTPDAGMGNSASRDDHIHPRLSSATVGTLDSNARATVMFTRSFATTPCVQCLLVEASDNQPVVFKVESWVMSGANYTGCVLRGYRSSVLPALSGILLIGPLISSLANYNVFGGSAANAQFCCLAIQPSN